MVRANPKHQVGDRRKTVDRISDYFNVDIQLRKKQLPVKTVHLAYEELTGNNRDIKKDKAWHLRKICDTLNIDTRKSMRRSTTRLPLNALESLEKRLQQASSQH